MSAIAQKAAQVRRLLGARSVPGWQQAESSCRATDLPLTAQKLLSQRVAQYQPADPLYEEAVDAKGKKKRVKVSSAL
jgi:hypothetical protein